MAGADEKEQVFQYLFYFIVRALLIALGLFIVVVGVLGILFLGDRVFSNGHNGPLFSSYVIVSESMVPTINKEDAIIVKRVDDDKYKVGDIISFNSNDLYYKNLTVTHRIVNKEKVKGNESLYTTKGDNNLVSDSSLVNTNDIYGKVVIVIPKIGYVNEFLSKPQNIFLMLFILVGSVIAVDSVRIGYVFYKKNNS